MLVMIKWHILHLKLTLSSKEKFICILFMFIMVIKMEIDVMETTAGRDVRHLFKEVHLVG